MAFRYVCLIPGLPAAWYRGMAGGLFISVLFVWSVCLLMLATFVWPAWFSLWLVRVLWSLLSVFWVYETLRSWASMRELLSITSEESSNKFCRAQEEYLKGNWFEAEAILLEIVHRFPRDAEALLLLVGVLRHTQRWQPALRRLKQLELLDTGSAWRFEIQQERSVIERAISSRATESVSGEEVVVVPNSASESRQLIES